jgi:hypothetical protein
MPKLLDKPARAPFALSFMNHHTLGAMSAMGRKLPIADRPLPAKAPFEEVARKDDA